jgi:hypothetical protein
MKIAMPKVMIPPIALGEFSMLATGESETPKDLP